MGNIDRANMVSRSIIISLAIIVFAHAITMSSDVVVPENNVVSPAHSSLLENIGKVTKEADKLTHSTHGSSTQVDEQSNQIVALKKQLAHIKENFEQTAPDDGGAADLASANTTAKEAITQAVTTMKTSVTGGFTTAKAAVVELEGAISTVERTIPTIELELIKVKSDEWCSSKTALDTASSEYDAAVTTFNAAAAPTLDSSLLAMSNFGPVTACDLSVGESEACSTSWSCDLAQTVENAISAARTTYHTAIWDKKNKEDTQATASDTNTGKQTSFLTAIETTIAAETAHCTGNDNIHASAVNAFNAVNTDRAAMYRQLSVVQCHVNHLDESDTSAVAVPEAATVGDTSTSAVDCVSKIKTKAQIKSSRFPDEALSGHASTCPTQTAYMNQIQAYGHPDMNLSDQWTPEATTCDNVANHGGSSNAFSYSPTGATCSTDCGQAGTDIVKYNCARNDVTVVDTANCVGLTLPTDYTETCAATAACAPAAPVDPIVCGGDLGNNMYRWADRTPANCNTISSSVNCCHSIPDDWTELSFPGLVTVGAWVHIYQATDRITKINLPDLRSANTIQVNSLPNVVEVNMPAVETITTNNANFWNLPSLTDQTFLSSGICASPIGRSGALGQMQSPSEAQGGAKTLTCPQ